MKARAPARRRLLCAAIAALSLGAGSCAASQMCNDTFDFSLDCLACLHDDCAAEEEACSCETECRSCVQQTWFSTTLNPMGSLACSKAPDSARKLLMCMEQHCAMERTPGRGPACPLPGVPVTSGGAPFKPDCAAPESRGACGEGQSECNPFDPTACPLGQACDISFELHKFVCNCAGIKGDITDAFSPCTVSPPKALCAACGYANDWCPTGMHCVGQCTRFCCADSDCASGRCDFEYAAMLLGGTPPKPIGLCAAP